MNVAHSDAENLNVLQNHLLKHSLNPIYGQLHYATLACCCYIPFITCEMHEIVSHIVKSRLCEMNSTGRQPLSLMGHHFQFPCGQHATIAEEDSGTRHKSSPRDGRQSLPNSYVNEEWMVTRITTYCCQLLPLCISIADLTNFCPITNNSLVRCPLEKPEWVWAEKKFLN